MNLLHQFYVLLLIVRDIMFRSLSRTSIFKMMKEKPFGLAVVMK